MVDSESRKKETVCIRDHKLKMELTLTLEEPCSTSISNFLITIKGIVQGVGFRPFVYRAAKKFSLKGYIKNDLEGVSIVLNASKIDSESFLNYVLENAPEKSKILKFEIKESDYEEFDDFEIIENQKIGTSVLCPTPDFGLCVSCKQEIFDENNRRHEYAFTTCAVCGPRYSIQTALPFERVNTSMHNFAFCSECDEEYTNPEDVRFHAQTISCKSCGIKMSLFDHNENLIEIPQEQMLDKVVDLLKAQMIVAVKGIGGFLLLADATQAAAVQKLRERKHRPTKPFAVLVENIEKLKLEAIVSEKEIEALESSMVPIVILDQLPTSHICSEINPKIEAIGLMMPNSPLLALISHKMGLPLLATSGNISGNPIVFDNQKAISELKPLADFILINDRDIIQPQDDSVVKFTKKHQKKVVIRRSKGHEIGVKNFDFSEQMLLAMGANMKSTFALKTNYNVYASQYLGDLENFETQQNYLLTLNRFLDCYTENDLKSPVDKVIVDLHPGYFSAEFGKTKAEEWRIPIQTIQHHEAHFTAVLAENDLLETPEKIMGVVWDGTGLGIDGNIWGGEFFVYEKKEILRVNHFGYFDSILNDKMAKEPRLSALSLLKNSNIDEDIISEKFTEIEFDFFRKILINNTLKTCSVGRIFDGVASILGLIDVQTYEGEAAMLLENLAFRFFNTHGYDWNESYFYQSVITELNITQTLVLGIVNDLENGKERAFVAAKFHISLVDMVSKIAEYNAAKILTFSGGVFQNTLLVDLLIEHLQGRFTVFFHQDLSPNDESISYGQIFHPSIN